MRKDIESIGTVDLREGIIPVSKAASALSVLIKRAHETRQPIVITQNGYPAAVVIDVDLYSSLREMAEAYLKHLSIQEDAEVAKRTVPLEHLPEQP